MLSALVTIKADLAEGQTQLQGAEDGNLLELAKYTKIPSHATWEEPPI